MRYAWLEKMAEEGTIRAEALDIIYERCSEVLEKTANHPFDGFKGVPNVPSIPSIWEKFVANPFFGPAVSAGTAITLMGGAEALKRKVLDMKVKAQIDVVRQKLLNDPALSSKKDKEKAEARLNEILLYAPSFASNEPVLRRYLFSKLNSGLTDKDVQGLISVQIKMTPKPHEYTQAQSDALVKKAFEEVRPSAEDVLSEVKGSFLAETVIFCKEAFCKEAAKGLNRDLAAYAGLAVSVPLLTAGVLGGIETIKSKMGEKEINAKIMKVKADVLADPEFVENRELARQAFDSLTHFSPHIAIEPFAAKSFVRKMVAYQAGPASSELKELTETERNMNPQAGQPSLLERSMNAAGLNRALGQAWAGGQGSALAGIHKDWVMN
jgi:hypothetical protein